VISLGNKISSDSLDQNVEAVFLRMLILYIF